MAAGLKVGDFHKSGYSSRCHKSIAMALFRAENQKLPDKLLKCLAELPAFKHSIVLHPVQQYIHHGMRNSPDIYISFVIEVKLQKRLIFRFGDRQLVAEAFKQNVELSIAENSG